MEGLPPRQNQKTLDQLPSIGTDELLDRKTFEALHQGISLMSPEERNQVRDAVDRLTSVVERDGIEGLESLDKMIIGMSTLAVAANLIAWATGGPLAGLIGALGLSMISYPTPNQKTERVTKRLKRLSRELKRHPLQ